MALFERLSGLFTRSEPAIAPARTLEIPGAGSSAVCEFSPDGTRLLLASEDGPVELWELERGERVRTFEAGREVEALAFSPDGSSIFASNNVGEGDTFASELMLLDAATGARRWTSAGTLSETYYARFTWDGRLLVLGSEEPWLTTLDARTGAERGRIQTDSPGPFAVEVSPDGERVLALCDEQVRLWNLADGTQLWSVEEESASVAAFSPEGEQVAIGGHDGALLLLDAASGKTLERWHGGTKSIGAVLFDGPGTLITGAGWNDEGLQPLRRWELRTGKELQRFRGHDGAVSSLALGNEGTSFWSVGDDDAVCEWRLGQANAQTR